MSSSVFVLGWAVSSQNTFRPQPGMLCVTIADTLAPKPEIARFQLPTHQLNDLFLWQPKAGFDGLKGCAVFPGHFDHPRHVFRSQCGAHRSTSAHKDTFGQARTSQAANVGFWPQPALFEAFRGVVFGSRERDVDHGERRVLGVFQELLHVAIVVCARVNPEVGAGQAELVGRAFQAYGGRVPVIQGVSGFLVGGNAVVAKAILLQARQPGTGMARWQTSKAFSKYYTLRIFPCSYVSNCPEDWHLFQALRALTC